ncbi:DUF4476 domain-containing protein [Desertivirga brevis]|uniref:DUF4476 domain-containing protein n=1 Tax=Desertivirga brevis TaxID=2810310 RepID=UPI001A964760|nr:DUF4476 domain-containing protein [Pedobacter sp. SYSU D00873]
MNTIKLITITALVFLCSLVNAQPSFRTAFSEYFIEVPARGRFTVSLGDESISSINGRFRFFDIREGRYPVVIEANNKVIYRSDVFVKPGIRTIAVLNQDALRPVKDLDLGRCSYDNWDKPLTEGYSNRPPMGRPYLNNCPPLMTSSAFERFSKSLRQASFDKNKLSVIDLTAPYAGFTVDQVIDVVRLMAFSDGKVSAVRKMFPSVTDPENAFMLLDAFDFQKDKDKVKSIIVTERYQRVGG